MHYLKVVGNVLAGQNRTISFREFFRAKEILEILITLDVTALPDITEEDLNNLYKILSAISGKVFRVPQTEVICSDCSAELEKCVSCDKPIGKNDIFYIFGDDDEEKVCQKCVEDGTLDVCQECGKAYDASGMTYFEGGGNVCENCREEYAADNYESLFSDEINELAENNPQPFKHWFGGADRIYLPFVPDFRLSQFDLEVKKVLEENGCNLSNADYQLGYCTYGKRVFKINRMLEKLRTDTIKAKEKEIATNPSLLAGINDFFQDLKRTFERSESRNVKNQDSKLVVISMNPDDIAKMSTGRNWTSCMNLGKRKEDVFCEVEEGGLIAYLIENNDVDIENPLARVLIRRFENEQGQSLAIPEKQIYGAYGPIAESFLDQVHDWLSTKQKDLPKGIYDRKGMPYSDSLGSIYRKLAQMVAEKIMKMAYTESWYRKMYKVASRKQEVKLVGKLMQTEDGFTYLKVSNNIINGFYHSIKEDGATKPPYDKKDMNNTGAHISVFYGDEVNENKLEIEELGDEFEFKVGKMYSVEPEGWDEMERVWFLEVQSPQLEKLRAKYGLSKKLNGHEFHITCAIKRKESK